MNIFVLDKNPKLSAKYHNDKHVVKMILEYAQLLSSSYYFTNEQDDINFNIYKLTHKNHPCTKWVNESLSNWLWLRNLALELNKEYKLRYNKECNHKSADLILNMKSPNLKDIGLTEFVFGVNKEIQDKYKDYDNITDKYRNYYMQEKIDIANWKTEVPEWFI